MIETVHSGLRPRRRVRFRRTALIAALVAACLFSFAGVASYRYPLHALLQASPRCWVHIGLGRGAGKLDLFREPHSDPPPATHLASDFARRERRLWQTAHERPQPDQHPWRAVSIAYWQYPTSFVPGAPPLFSTVEVMLRTSVPLVCLVTGLLLAAAWQRWRNHLALWCRELRAPDLPGHPALQWARRGVLACMTLLAAFVGVAGAVNRFVTFPRGPVLSQFLAPYHEVRWGRFGENNLRAGVIGGTFTVSACVRVASNSTMPTFDRWIVGATWEADLYGGTCMSGVKSGPPLPVHLQGTHAYRSTLTISVWALCLFLLAVPAIAFLRGPFRRAKRRARGLCIACGYNLTGLPEPRCPECGNPTPAHPRTPTAFRPLAQG